MITQIASFGRTNPTSGLTTRAVSPAADAPSLRDRPRRADVAHPASAVALAPAAMTALIEAQEHLAQGAPAPVRQRAAEKIDQLLYRLDVAPAAADANADASLAVRQLQVARDALSERLIDLQT